MQITLAHVSPHSAGRAKMSAVEALVADYVTRCGAWAHVEVKAFASEARLMDAVATMSKRTRPVVCLLDSGGKQLSSEKFAAQLERWRDSGRQNLFFCVGPADGWSGVARERADMLMSLGPMTLAHGIARVVLAEQVYRGLSILSGHPYHGGH
jgi:23S rRNA (pseudouridine1915-N3)-methyltransferase